MRSPSIFRSAACRLSIHRRSASPAARCAHARTRAAPSWTVKPHQRELLADRIMNLDGDPQERAADQHILSNREGAHGRQRHLGRRVRLQLRRAYRPRNASRASGWPRWRFCAGGAAPPPRAANTEASSRVTIFREPSTCNAGITVIHPQVDASAALGPDVQHQRRLRGRHRHAARRPRTFGPTSGVDAVTGATHFSDIRQEVKGGFDFNRRELGAVGGLFVRLGERLQVQRRLGHHAAAICSITTSRSPLAYTHNFDSVCDANNGAAAGQPLNLQPLASSTHCFQSGMADVITHKLSIDTFEPSLTWTATPRFVVQGGSTIQILDGFQSNPYRAVLVGSQHRTPQEHMPRLPPALRRLRTGRLRAARPARVVDWRRPFLPRQLGGHGRAPPSSTTTSTSAAAFLFTLRGRYHQQTGASFYRTSRDYQTLGPAGQYWTGDRELSPMSNFLVGAKLAYSAARVRSAAPGSPSSSSPASSRRSSTTSIRLMRRTSTARSRISGRRRSHSRF